MLTISSIETTALTVGFAFGIARQARENEVMSAYRFALGWYSGSVRSISPDGPRVKSAPGLRPYADSTPAVAAPRIADFLGCRTGLERFL